MLAVERVVEKLKEMSKPVTTPEEIAQVFYRGNWFCVYYVCAVTGEQ